MGRPKRSLNTRIGGDFYELLKRESEERNGIPITDLSNELAGNIKEFKRKFGIDIFSGPIELVDNSDLVKLPRLIL